MKSNFQGLFPHDVYKTWFEPLTCVGEAETQITLGVPNDFARIWIQDNYEDLIQRELAKAAGHSVAVEFQVIDEVLMQTERRAGVSSSRLDSDIQVERPRPSADGRRSRQCGDIVLNPRNNFENFVVGPGNQLAHAACIAVANAPAKAYNPLFLYGATGLGKTHLMHAIAHQILAVNPDACVAYVSTENFTNQFIEAIQSNNVARFRQRYRKVNVLLIDDVQFLEGKERIQEEFFHTFNELFERQKQIVLTSDRPAGEIARLESRLLSRFQWGLVADITPPDFETRLAILRKKARSMNLELEDEILQFLAERVSRNVRRMEGALTRVASYQTLMKSPIRLSNVTQLLQDVLAEETREPVTIELIQEKVADYYDKKVADLSRRKRTEDLVKARHIAMYLCRMLTSHSLQVIGTAFGGRDHGTVLHACRSIEDRIGQNPKIAEEVAFLQNKLRSARS